jgi:hypothetical protein
MNFAKTPEAFNGAIDENWIRMIPCPIQILSLLLSPQDDALHIEVSSLIHQIALNPSHLNLLSLPDSNGDNNNHGDDDHQSRRPCLDDTLGVDFESLSRQSRDILQDHTGSNGSRSHTHIPRDERAWLGCGSPTSSHRNRLNGRETIRH